MALRWLKFGLVLALLAAIGGLPGRGQVTPPAPQTSNASDGADGPGFVRVQSSLKGGTGGYIDIPGYASCRYVTTNAGGDPSANGEVIPVAHLADWQAWILRSNPAGDTATVCCRPSTDTLCQGAAGGTVSAPVLGAGGKASAGYQVINGAGFATATCHNGSYGAYVDTRNYVCLPAGGGATQDGKWVQQGLDTDNCQPNAYTAPCNATCPGGSGQIITYNSCGQVQSVSACSASCCTPTAGSCSSSCTTLQGGDNCGNACYGSNVCTCGGGGSVSWEDDYFVPANGSQAAPPQICTGALPDQTVYAGQSVNVATNSVAAYGGDGGGSFAICYGGNATIHCDQSGWITTDDNTVDGLVSGSCGSSKVYYSGSDPNVACGGNGTSPPSGGSCSPSSIDNGSVGSYPNCSISCNSGYVLSGSSCVPTSSSSGTVTCGPCNQSGPLVGFKSCSDGTQKACTQVTEYDQCTYYDSSVCMCNCGGYPGSAQFPPDPTCPDHHNNNFVAFQCPGAWSSSNCNNDLNGCNTCDSCTYYK